MIILLPTLGCSSIKQALDTPSEVPPPFTSNVQINGGHLWWDLNLSNRHHPTLIYGEICILSTHPSIYYCGFNWNPGFPAGGYCGIQDNSLTERRSIFSIWDSDDTHPTTLVSANATSITSRFSGEGSGEHTHELFNWVEGQVFRFAVIKKQIDDHTTQTSYYRFPSDMTQLIFVATLQSPTLSDSSVPLFQSGSSFLENFSGSDFEHPKIALYRLWKGDSVDHLEFVKLGIGDPKTAEWNWGQCGPWYFLVEGNSTTLNTLLVEKARQLNYKITLPNANNTIAPLENQPLPDQVLTLLRTLP